MIAARGGGLLQRSSFAQRTSVEAHPVRDVLAPPRRAGTARWPFHMPPRTLAIARAHMRVLLRRLIHFSPEHLKRRAFVLLRRPVTARRPTCPSRPCPCTITIDHRRKAGMMTRATVTSRVVAEIYRGVEFPAGWVDKPDVLNVGMARDTVASVAAMFDAELKPIALCWRIGGGEETFACASSGATDGTSLVDGLNSALAQESLRLGTEDLLGTMLWAPDELRPDQGQAVHRIEFLRGNAGACQFPLTGWNIPPRTLVARAGELLMMTRSIDDGLEFPMPTNIEEMHRHLSASEPRLLTVLPGSIAVAFDKNVGKKMAWLFGGLLATGVLICAYLLGRA